MDNILKNINENIQNLDILENIEKKIKLLDNNKKILVFLGCGLESFLLVNLLKKHFKKNLHCVLLNTPSINEKEFPDIISEYYKSDIKVLAINCREYFYKNYIMFEENLNSKIIISYNKIIENYNEYLKEDIEYFSFGFIKSSSNLNGKMKIENKKSFEPFLDLEKKEIQTLANNYNINKYFTNREDYWKETLN